MGQALLEQRLLDIPLANPVFRALTGLPLSPYSLFHVHPHLGKCMLSFQRLVAKAIDTAKQRLSNSRRAATSSFWNDTQFLRAEEDMQPCGDLLDALTDEDIQVYFVRFNVAT